MSASLSIPRLAVVVIGVAVLTSGCSWFRRGDSPYTQSPESRPLEVPPDLDLPRTDGAMKLPPGTPAAAPAATAASPTGFTVPGAREATFERVGTALAGIEGVTIASRAQLLGAFDVNYQGTNFLVRVSPAGENSYVSAVDPRGLPATGEAPLKLIAALKSALGN